MSYTFEKPNNWNDKSFVWKMNYYSKFHNDIKGSYSDKKNVKNILKFFNIPDLYFAKEIPTVNHLNTNLNSFYLPVKYLATDIDKIFAENNFNEQILNNLNITTNSHNTTNYIIKPNIGWNTYVLVINNQIKKMIFKGKSLEHNFNSF